MIVEIFLVTDRISAKVRVIMKYALTVISSFFCLCLFLTSCGEKDPAPSEGTAGDTTPVKADAPTTPSSESSEEESATEETPEAATEDPTPADPAPTPDPAPAPDPEPAEDPAAKKPAPASVIAFTAELREKGVLELIEELEEAEEDGGENPLQILDNLRRLNELSDVLSTINTEELPEDLKEPVDRFRDATSDTAAHLEEMPIPVDILTAGQEAIGQWFGEKMAEDPLFLQSMEDWGETMQELGGEMEDSGGAIERAFDTYDIDPLAP